MTSKREPWSLQESPGSAKRRSRGSQKSTMMAQDGTRRRQEEVLERKNCAKEASKGGLDGSRYEKEKPKRTKEGR